MKKGKHGRTAPPAGEERPSSRRRTVLPSLSPAASSSEDASDSDQPAPPSSAPSPPAGEAYAAMATRIRACAQEYLRSVGYAVAGSAGADRGAFLAVAATPTGVVPVGFDAVWARMDNVMEVTVLDILLTNIMAQQQQTAGVRVTSDHEDMWHMLGVTAEELAALPLTAVNDDGSTFSLLPEQLLAMMRLARGVGWSSLRVAAKNPATPDAPFERPLATFTAIPAANAAAQSSFEWVISTMGSGKTVMTLFAAVSNLCRDWAACRAALSDWTLQCRRLQDSMPYLVQVDAGPPQLRRALLVVATASTFTQWVDVVRANLPLLRQHFGMDIQMFPATGYGHHRTRPVSALPPDCAPTIYVVQYDDSNQNCFKRFVNGMRDTAIVAAVLDELPDHAGALSCVSGMPLIYRTYGVSATPRHILVPERGETNAMRGRSMQNYLKSKFNPSEYKPRDLETFGRGLQLSDGARATVGLLLKYITADSLISIRYPLAAAVAPLMSPSIRVHTMRAHAPSLAYLTGVTTNDLFPITVNSLLTRLLTRLVRPRAGAPFQTPYATSTDAEAPSYHSVLLDVVQEVERMSARFETSHVMTACVRCGCWLGMAEAALSACCCSLYCGRCAVGTCGRCAAVAGTPSEAETAALAADATLEQKQAWLTAALDGVRVDGSASFGVKVRRSLAALMCTGCRTVIVFIRFGFTPVPDILAAVRACCPEGAWVRGLCRENGHKLDRDALQATLKEFKYGDAHVVRVLVLRDQERGVEHLDQITGLDLSTTDAMFALGETSNPQQAFSRALRATAAPRNRPITLVRLLQA